VSALNRIERAVLAGTALATVLAALARYASGVSAVLAFVLSGLALAGLAWLVSLATEQIGERFGPAVTGVLQSTIGNLPEFFVVIFALQGHQKIVAQTAILGSILVNALLVLGVVLIVGSLRERDGIMRFSPRLPNDTATLLLTSSFIIVLIGLADSAHDSASHHSKTISIIGAIAILAVYAIWLYGYLRSDTAPAKSEGTPEPGEARGEDQRASAKGPRVPLATSLTLLVVAGFASAFVSDWFVHALQPTIHTLKISQTFAGLVIVAIAGNAVENVAGIVLAAHGQADLAISIVKNSVAQIAAFLFPLLVLVSLLTATSLTFALAPVYIGALLVTALIVWQITGDGEATAFEGAALVATFIILATVAAFET
jgi:Ca2+:H+ antiporter